MSSVNNVDYSIIICTYDPDERLLKRCLAGVQSLLVEGFTTEVILVDNNSTIALESLDYIQGFLACGLNSRLIEVKEPGLLNARIGGIKAARGEWIVFFDDDNEPDLNYLKALNRLKKQYPKVVAWGPGEVDVEFIDGVAFELKDYPKLKEAFQDRHVAGTFYSNQHSWQDCYPFGTGLCIVKEYLVGYIELVEKGLFTMSGRKGGLMTSGEDTQMVLYCLSKGGAAGISCELMVIHITPGRRLTLDYLKRMSYGTTVCHSLCVQEVFPEYRNEIEQRIIRPAKFVRKALKKYVLLKFSSKLEKIFGLIDYIAIISGDYIALGKPIPSEIHWILKRLKVF